MMLTKIEIDKKSFKNEENNLNDERYWSYLIFVRYQYVLIVFFGY